MSIYFFGCWNESGHFLFPPGGGHVPYEIRDTIEWIRQDGDGIRVHLDGTLAPRKFNQRWLGTFGQLCWAAQGETDAKRSRIRYDSEEYPQGQFLHHQLDNGFCAISWWDRHQGDSRGACNSTFLWRGEHAVEEMLAGLRQHFPHVVENLKKAGVEPVEVKKP